MGQQPVEKYMDILSPKDEQTGERKGWMNMSWDIMSVAPKFRRIFVGMFEKMEHDITCSAIDPLSIDKREKEKWGLWADKELQSFMKDFDESMGIPDQPSAEDLPETLQELEMFMEEGFKLNVERAMEQGIDYAFYLSDWAEIKKSIFEDFFDIGVAACQDYVDVETQKVKVKYLDPAQLIVRYSRSRTFDNIDHWGYVKEYTIAEIRTMCKGDLSEDELKMLARQYCGYAGNPDTYQWDWYGSTPVNTDAVIEEWRYDSFKVCVVFGEWISDDYKVTQTRRTPDGAERTFNESIAFTKKSSDKRKIEKTARRMVYKGHWIVGTNHIFDYGYQHDIPRPGKKEVSLSLNIYKVADKSILASIIPNLDNFQLTWLKLQNAIAMAAPAGLSIETSVLDNMTIGGQMMSEMDILTIRRQTGDLLYRATTHHSETQSPMASRPITPIEGGIGNQLQEFISLMDLDIKMIRDMTGMNEVSDASTPSPYQPVQTSKLAVEATINSLQPVYSGYVYIKERVAKNFCLRYQVIAKYNDITGYYPALGRNNMEVIKITADISMAEYGIKVQMRPSDDMKAMIRGAAEVSLQRGSTQGGIDYSDYIFVVRIMDTGNLKYAQMVLASREKRNKMMAQQLQEQNMQLNAQTAQQTEQVKAELLMQAEQIKAQAQIEVLNAKSKNTIEEQNNKASNEIRKVIIEKKLETGSFTEADHILATGEYPGVPEEIVDQAVNAGMDAGIDFAAQQQQQMGEGEEMGEEMGEVEDEMMGEEEEIV
jgi:hypothetical protein